MASITLHGLDFETYCDLDLKKVGLDRYVNHPSFTPLCAQVVGPQYAHAFDFVHDEAATADFLQLMQTLLVEASVVAHNAGFERAVLRRMYKDNGTWCPELLNIRDSAVVARQLGASSSLEKAAPQLTPMQKLSTGLALIKIFSVPTLALDYKAPTAESIKAAGLWSKWQDFLRYCAVDAEAGLGIMLHGMQVSYSAVEKELGYENLTAQQNERGWPVDIELVDRLGKMYDENVVELEEWVRREDPSLVGINLGSTAQLTVWCRDRGVRVTSLDEEHVNTLIDTLNRKLDSMKPGEPRYWNYNDVLRMLEVKRDIGGASLRKLQVIARTTGDDGRLRNQYMHLGAGQSYRSTGRGVQMQNLPRLGQHPADMDDLLAGRYSLPNYKIAENLRQVFVPSVRPNGALIVGDFSSVESRGLAYLAGEDWKVQAYRAGKDLYKVLAEQIYHTTYDLVTKEQRQTGKVGELSCGYGAGSDAVASFARGMGVEMTPTESTQLVSDWRAANPKVTAMWKAIDEALHRVMTPGMQSSWVSLGSGTYWLEFTTMLTPPSLAKQHPGAKSIKMTLYNVENGRQLFVLERVFHGCYFNGRNVNYYKPSDKQGGALWLADYRDPKTGKRKSYNLYGGKITGILVQSFCREMFFYVMETVEYDTQLGGCKLIGQFHDELVIDMPPSSFEQRADYIKRITDLMSRPPYWAAGFPLAADVKWDVRYTK